MSREPCITFSAKTICKGSKVYTQNETTQKICYPFLSDRDFRVEKTFTVVIKKKFKYLK